MAMTKPKPAATKAQPPQKTQPAQKAQSKQKTLAKWTTDDETLMFSLVKDHEGDVMLSVEDLQSDNDDAIVTLATTVSELDETLELLQAARVRMMRAEGSGEGPEDEDEDDENEDEGDEDEEDESEDEDEEDDA